MAIVEKFIASVEVGDSNSKLASASMRVGAVDGRAYVAAAGQAARDATQVGALLTAALDMTAAHGTNHYKKWSIQCDFVNDAFTYQPDDDAIFNSNKWKVTYSTTNNGIPAKESIYIPQRSPDVPTVGVDATLDAAPTDEYIAELIDTGLSSYGTAITAVLEIVANDS